LVKVFAETLFVGRAARFVPAAQQPQSLHGKQGKARDKDVVCCQDSRAFLTCSKLIFWAV